jgi:cobalamin biosynthesis protein CbiG
VTLDQIETAIGTCLAPNTIADVATVATLETKAGEPGLTAFCERHRVPLVTFSAQDIQACFSRYPSLRASPHVQTHLGVDGVCEPCALLAAADGMLIREKQALDGVTVAVAASGKSDKQDRSRTS